jgi:succinyl-diaminopimelate desuccinylase
VSETVGAASASAEADAAVVEAFVRTAPADDLLALTAALVDVPSESHHEAHLADLVEARLAGRAGALDVTRVADNVVVRTHLGRERRVVLGGHLDTVPANGNDRATIDGDVVHGVGAADMKGGLAVLLRLAEELAAAPADGAGAPRHDVTLVLYEGEEVADEFNGLRHVLEVQPDLLAADFAVLLEPTDGWVEAGCQGFLIVRAEFDGARAHTARPWMGVNAIHRASAALARVAAHESDTVRVDGLEFRESLQAVRMEGGVTGKHNVVPDTCALVVNRRFAPAYSAEEAREQVEALLADADRVEVLQAQPAAAPNLANPLVADFVTGLELPVRPKLGWTDVARFASRGVPAVNFGPGDPTIAHTAGELVTRAGVERCYEVLARFVGL